jgi:hypothetical protein
VQSVASLGFSSGLAHTREGSFVISKCVDKNVFILVSLDDESAGRRNVDALKLYCEQPEWSQKQQENDISDTVCSTSNGLTDTVLCTSKEDGKMQRPKRKIV